MIHFDIAGARKTSSAISMGQRSGVPVFYPILLTIFPVLSVYSEVVKDVQAEIMIAPTIVLEAGTVVLWACLWAVLRDLRRGAFIVGVVLLWIFAYTPVWRVIPHHDLLENTQGAKALFFFAWTALAGVLIWRFHNHAGLSGSITAGLNVFSVFLILMPVFTVARSVLPYSTDVRIPAVRAGDPHSAVRPPDIYYIILDEGARHDVLVNLYGYDDTWFLDSLSTLGFRVCASSRSNYGQTMMSLGSSLNLSFIDDLVGERHRVAQDERPLRALFERNAVFHFLHQQGYWIGAVSSGYTETADPPVDEYISPFLATNEFDQKLWQNTTLARILIRIYPRWEQALHRKRILFGFDNLSSFASPRTPFLFFAHIVAPHAPFVFGKDGEMVAAVGECSFDFLVTDTASREKYVREFRSQMEYTEKLTLAAVRQILQRSSFPPIIIIQGDHGPASHLDWDHPDKIGLEERLSILNALYLPAADSVAIPDSLTPVNTFRIIFNKYFGAGLPLLPNRSLYSKYGEPYTYTGRIE